MIFILNNEIFSNIYLILDFISGLSGLTCFFNNNLSYSLLIITSIAPTIILWILAILAIIFYNNVRRMSYIDYKKNKNNNKKIHKIKLDQEFTCPICLEIGENIGYYVCNNKHYYHYDCINTWINKFNNNKCPTCRS